MYQVLPESSEFYRRYDKKTFRSFFPIYSVYTDIAVTVFNIVHHYNRSIKQVIDDGG